MTQVAFGLLAAAAAAIIAAGVAQAWMLFLITLLNGIVFAPDQTARQVYVVDLVGADRLASAVGLYEIILNVSRVAGPALGGALLATVGVAACCAVNAASYAIPLFVAPTVWLAFAGLAVVGLLSIWFIAAANTLVQLASGDEMRGRTMGLWTMALPGAQVVTGPFAGWVTQDVGPGRASRCRPWRSPPSPGSAGGRSPRAPPTPGFLGYDRFRRHTWLG